MSVHLEHAQTFQGPRFHELSCARPIPEMTELEDVQAHETFAGEYRLSRVSKQDTEALVKNLSNPALSETLHTPPFPYTSTNAEEWYAFLETEKEKDPKTARFRWVIRHVPSKTMIGDISLCKWKRTGQYRLGFWLAEEYWGKGIMTEAVATVIDIAKEEEDVEMIVADVDYLHWASRRVLEKNGFEFIGELHDTYRMCQLWLFELYL